MPNRREFDPITSYNFKVEIEGVTTGSFMEVEGLESITSVVRSKNGDDLIRRNQIGQTTYTNLILRRGFTNTDDLLLWRKAVIDGNVQRKAGSIIILNSTGAEIMRFNFLEAWPCRWKLGKLSSLTDSLLIEEVELVVEKIEKG
jgi:phage tail-like protein